MKYIVTIVLLMVQGTFVLAQGEITWQWATERVSENEVYLTLSAKVPHGHILMDNEGYPLRMTIDGDGERFTPIGNLERPVTQEGFYQAGVEFRQLLILNDPSYNSNIPVELQYAVGKENRIEEVSRVYTVPVEKYGNPSAPSQDRLVGMAQTQQRDGSTKENGLGLWPFMVLAFGSGLAALLTPCVFPMIPLTVSFFGGRDDAPSKGIRNLGKTRPRRRGLGKAVGYGCCIILIYVVAGTVVAQINGPEFANWLSTHWVPNLLFFVIFLVFALSFLGLFELTLPNTWVNRMDRLSGKKGMLGIFFMAFTLVLVSFSCTGPIVGNVLVLSAGGEVLKPVVGMFSFSLALALPFTLFAAFPQWLEKLPRSGGWLQEVKVFLGFLELALALKFLSIADQVYHWGLLDRDIYLAVWIVIFALLGFYLLGKLRLPHDSDKKNTSVPKLMLAIVVFGFVVYLVPGMIGAPLKPLSGYLPPLTTQDFVLLGSSKGQFSPNEEEQNPVILSAVERSTGFPLEGCPAPKYTDLLKLPHGLQGYFDLEQAKQCAKAQDKPIFVDFTGHGCVNCRAMEARVWSDPRVLEILTDDYVVVALYVDDKTELPKADWYTSEYDGKIKRTLGSQNADHQITAFTNNAQPFYVLLSPEGEPLTEPKAYDLDIERFVSFLQEGLKNHQNHGAE